MSKILVIDDETTILDNIKFVLGLENLEVLTSSNAIEGIKIFNDHIDEIDAVVTDMKMPELSGMDVLKEIKKLCPAMSVIILTGHGEMENAIEAMKEGAFEYISKPVNADKLAITINNAVHQKKLMFENDRMHREILENRNYLQGLHDSAQKILMNIEPKNLQSIKGIDYFKIFKSSDAVGGDMYNISDIGDYISFYVFDVSNHGILAAVIATILNSFLQNIQYNYKQGINKRRFPEIMNDLNLDLYSKSAQNVFASLFLGFIDKKHNVLYYVSAGHIDQILLKKDGITYLEPTGAILGVFEDVNYTCNVVNLDKNDKIFLFTDGIIEAFDGEKIFSNEQLEDTIYKNKNNTLPEIINKIYSTANKFCNENFADDVTLLGIEILTSKEL